MKNLTVIALMALSLNTMAETLEERAAKVDNFCDEAKFNIGVYKKTRTCSITLEEKEAGEVAGICRGTLKRKYGDITYKVTFSTGANKNLKYIALGKGFLWNIDTKGVPSVEAYQPTHKKITENRIVIVKKSTQTSFSTSGETFYNLKTDKIDIAFSKGSMFGFEGETKKSKASIIVESSGKSVELENAYCDFLM